ncbi:hypothetical protein Pcinc_009512 [Petrolisthes cinctipes]|uniref:Large ribosomal subunit protein mL44 n=1 Tax=Petrolisthes cinctipes TaxID=88211 RepID=A0AAE1G7A6_PETCI|nr:hypothetical protein Pcinc_009512 [Petrolisthes cinctipes]
MATKLKLGHSLCTSLLTRVARKQLTVRNINTTASVFAIEARWTAPYLRDLAKRKKIMEEKGLFPQDKRSEYIEWNYDAELYAFGKRLQEEFEDEVLRAALTDASYIRQEIQRQQDLGVSSPALMMSSNEELSDGGAKVITDYSSKFLRAALPLFPEEGISAVTEYLSSEVVLAEVGFGIGLRDLILCQEHPPAPSTAARALQAVVGALHASSGLARTQAFVRDFVLAHLSGKDINSIWKVEDPMKVLSGILARSGCGEPEPRIIFQSGKNTIQAVYQVGIYTDKNFIGSGYGETVGEAVEQATHDALRRLFHTTDSTTPLPFGPAAADLTLKESSNLTLQDWSLEKAKNVVSC